MATRSKETENQYTTKGRLLLMRAARALGLQTWREHPERVCREIGDWRPKWKPATWRFNKAALVHVLKTDALQECAEYVGQLSQTPCARKSTKTSTKKLKRLPPVMFRRLTAHLKKGGGRYDCLIRNWLIIARWTGLRPCEWERAKVVGNLLVVQNAKTSNKRSFGPVREIDLKAIKQGPKLVKQFLNELRKLAHQDAKPFETIYRDCRTRLQQVNSILGYGKKRITLYSPRHQFIADLKRMEMTPDEIAAAVGHGSIHTMNKHYARKNRGRRRTRRVGPSSQSVKAAQQAQRGRNPRAKTWIPPTVEIVTSNRVTPSRIRGVSR